MHRFQLISRLILAALCFHSHSWAGGEPTLEWNPHRWATIFSEQSLSNSPSKRRSMDPLFQSSVSSTFTVFAQVSSRLQHLSPETDSPRIQGLVAQMSWLKGSLVTETEIANSYGGADWLHSNIPGDNENDASKRMVRLGITGSKSVFRYGLTLRKAGQAFLNAPDQSSREVWGEWRARWVTLRSAVGQLWNNVSEDRTRPRLTQTYGRMGLGLAKPSWPELSLTHARNSFSSMLEPLGIAPQRTQSHSLEGALAYQSLRWNVKLISSYALTNDLLRREADNKVRTQLLSASFQPLNTFTISPMLGYREEIQDLSGVRIDGPSASVTVRYRQSRRLWISAMGNYASSRSNDGQFDQENVGGKGILAWDWPQRSKQWNALIALEAGYNRVSNRVTPAADTEDISGLVRIVLADL